MRKLFGLLVVGGLIAMLTTDANAQRPGFGGGGSMFLLQNKGVQEELKITEEQIGKIKTASEDLQKKFPRTQFGKKDERTAEEKQKAAKERTEATAKAVAEILNKEQATRLKQIERQQSPSTTLTTDEETVKAVGLTDEQKEKIKGIAEENQKEMRGLFTGGGFNKEATEKMATLRKELKEKTLKVLTEEQTKKWSELTGAAFEVKFEFGGGKGTTPKKKDD